ncbi:MAG: sigma 54-interacting transcriptional regulator [Dichotomicrobium sp.]
MQPGTFIYRAAATSEIVAQAEKAAHGSANILIEGAPGTGKTVLAEFIHTAGQRHGEIVTIDCAAGANPASSFIECADGQSTLFLHGADEMTAAAQAELAMALRTDAPSPRLVAASSRGLSEAARDGRFREDLYYQLAVVTLHLPPLAERADDIPALAAHFAARFATAHGMPPRALADDALAALSAYRWPGNVRELENVIHRAVLFAEGDTIRAADISLSAAPVEDGDGLSASLVGRTVADVERELILETLRHCGGNRTQAADILGISVRTLRNKIRQYHEEGAEVPAFSRAA